MTRPPRPLWAYAYRLLPPQTADRLKGIKALLEREHAEATRHESTWEGRLVVDERISHILVLTDSPELDLAANHRIESRLRALEADFALTVPMPILDEPTDVAAPGPANVPRPD
jgi:hypothetical protein